MPGLLNLWYEQMPYHKILPLEYNLSMKISCHRGFWPILCPALREAKSVAARSDLTTRLTARPKRRLDNSRNGRPGGDARFSLTQSGY